MPESTASSSRSKPTSSSPEPLPKEFQIANRGDRFLTKLKDKREDMRVQRAIKQSQAPPRSLPINANPPSFASSSSLSVVFSNNFGFSQGCMLSNSQLRVTGMGGWDPQTGEIPYSLNDEIAIMMDNVERTLRELRWGAGWDFVYVVKTYHTDLEESRDLMAAHLCARMQRHRPMWSCVEVRALKVRGMRVECEVEAYLEKQDAAV